MIRFNLTMEFGQVKDDEPEPLPGEGGPGGAQVEDAGYGNKAAQWTGTGFALPDTTDPGPEGPY